MPAAHVAVQSLMMNSYLQSALGQLNALSPERTGPNPYYMGRAKSYAEQGEKLIDRMAFWSMFPLIGDKIVGKLAEKLERVTDEVESFVRMAG